MFAIGSRWMLERNMLVLKIIGTAKVNNIEFIDNQIKAQMISKIVQVILKAEKYSGKALDIVPTMPNQDKTFVVCSSIIFTNESNLMEFQKACPQILYQG